MFQDILVLLVVIIAGIYVGRFLMNELKPSSGSCTGCHCRLPEKSTRKEDVKNT